MAEEIKDDIKLTKKESATVLKRLLSDAKQISGWLALSAIVSAGSVFLALMSPIFIASLTDAIYDYWAIGRPFIAEETLRNSLMLVGIYFLSALCSVINTVLMNNCVSRYYTCGLRIRMSDKIKRMPVSYVDKTPNGEIISRMMHDVSRMGTSIHTLINLATVGILQLIGITYMMFRINYIMALIVLVTVPISLVVATVISGKSRKHFDAAHDEAGKMYSHVEESYSGFEAIKAYNLEQSSSQIMHKTVDKLTSHDIKGNFNSEIIQPLVAFTNNVSFVIICVVGSLLAISGALSGDMGSGTITVGSIVAVTAYSRMFAGPIESIAHSFTWIQRTFASARRVYAFLDEPEMPLPQIYPEIPLSGICPETPLSEIYGITPETNGVIEFRNVCFSYSPDKPLIENMNLTVKAGQKVAIVGPTGGGKTTIVNLLMRFYDVNSGEIFVDGVDITKIERERVRSLFAMVLQDTWVYNGTIAENIAYGKENATDGEVREAAQNAHLDHFISTLPEGFASVLNEDSTNISSGQKQLITIARAYVANRNILILDEATSNVDTRTELLIQATMDKLMRNRTSFVIAHRLSTIVDADTILVINEGQIVETGSHKELMEKNGFYSEIYRSQYDLLK